MEICPICLEEILKLESHLVWDHEVSRGVAAWINMFRREVILLAKYGIDKGVKRGDLNYCEEYFCQIMSMAGWRE